MKIIEDIDNDRVIINNIIIDGFIDDEKCSICSNSPKSLYSPLSKNLLPVLGF